MDAQFWINAWNEGRTNFHQESYHEMLLKYFPALKPLAGQKVLVPLCGKTKDLIWLQGLGISVHGVELHEGAIRSFFSENNLFPITETQDHDFKNYKFKEIEISCGDFFKLASVDTYEFVYDRASLVALPLSMRKKYVEIIKRSLKVGGKCLLIVYEYDQSKMEGPPFSIDENEIYDLYGNEFKIDLVDNQRPEKEGARLASLADSLRQKVYILEKRSSPK